MFSSRFVSVVLLISIVFELCLILPFSSIAADEWLPIGAADLALKDNPASPGSNAMILYRQEHTDSSQSFETEYFRIKIFTEAGKKWGDVEIPFVKGRDDVKDIRARTVRPDGSIIPFQGRIFEKEIVKAGGIKVLEKTFTMPDVQPGCIIEYKYRVQYDSDYYWNVGTSRRTFSRAMRIFQFVRQRQLTPPLFMSAHSGWASRSSRLRRKAGTIRFSCTTSRA